MAIEVNGNVKNISKGPLDEQSIYGSLTAALTGIVGNTRVKGQKFVVKGNDTDDPIEYIITKDYVPAGYDASWNEVPEYIPTIENGGITKYLPDSVVGYDDSELRSSISGVSGSLLSHVGSKHDWSSDITTEIGKLNGSNLPISGLTTDTINDYIHFQ